MYDDDDYDNIYGYSNENPFKESFRGALSEESPDLDETPLPFYLATMFPTKENEVLIDHENKDRGNWDTQFEYLLSCIGYAVGLGNIWRFPAKVYQGGGGAFLIPYLMFCLLVGGPMMMLEMSLGQFCGLGCSRAFDLCPLFAGIGWTIALMSFLVLINYTIVISWCMLYMVSSFQTILPWSVCTNPFNTPKCINTSMNINVTNKSLESSTIQFWSFYVTREQRHDGSFIKITDPLGSPSTSCIMCMILILIIASLTIMFGVKISGKIIYLTVIFPYIAILQFIILGCTLPGALKGVKFYLYPDPKKLIDGNTYLMALEQLLFSCGIGIGGMITMSSFNRFRDNIYRNVIVVMVTDFFTSFISGFATFPVLGYMSYRSGKDIKDIITADSSLFFITYPEALATISSSNVWSVLFMFMAFTLGIDSLFVLLETVTMAFLDFWPSLNSNKYKFLVTIVVCIVTFFLSILFVTPGGLNWVHVFDSRISSFILTLSVVLEAFIICGVYGIRNFQTDIELMTGKSLNSIWLFILCIFGPGGAGVVLILDISRYTPLVRFNVLFPSYVTTIAWICNFLILTPIIVNAIFILVKYKINNPDLDIWHWLKLCITPPITWGPKSKRYWVQSTAYSEKLLKYKDNPIFLASFTKDDNVEKLVHLAEKQLGKSSV